MPSPVVHSPEEATYIYATPHWSPIEVDKYPRKGMQVQPRVKARPEKKITNIPSRGIGGVVFSRRRIWITSINARPTPLKLNT